MFVCVFQADAFLQGDLGEVLPAVQRHEDGSCPTRTPLGDWPAQRQRAGLRRVRHLQGRAGRKEKTMCIRTVASDWLIIPVMLLLSLQAYPEYLITYQILKPDPSGQSAAAAEHKS